MKIRKLIQADCALVCEKNYHYLNSLKNQNILITGGTGFIGKWLLEMILYLNDNYHFKIKVTVVSRNAKSILNEQEQFARNDVKFIEADIRNPIEISDDITYIIHAAATPVSQLSNVDQISVFNTIIRGTTNVLDSSLRLSNVVKILNISSGQIYGSPNSENQKIKESEKNFSIDSNSIHSFYSESKRVAESICAVYRSQFKLPILTVRPFSFVGPYQPLNGSLAVSNFIRDSFKGGPIKIFSDGESIRTYMYPSDMAFWILTILANGNIGSVFNVGSSVGIKLSELAEKIARLFKKQIQIQIKQLEDIHLNKSVIIPDVDLAKKEFKLEMRVDLDTALEKAIFYYKSLNE